MAQFGENAVAGMAIIGRLTPLAFSALFVLSVAAVLFFARAPIAALFNASGIARELVFLFCGPLALAFLFNGVLFVSNAAFNNLGRPFYSTWLNWARHTLGTIPFVMLGAYWFGAPGGDRPSGRGRVVWHAGVFYGA
jgi:Na+-driven multidrug efflux pump